MKQKLYEKLACIKWVNFMLLSILSLPILATAEAPLDLATVPLTTSSADKVKPNMLYVLDDSISMSFEYLPDWAEDVIYQTGANNPTHPGRDYHNDASYNALAYDPAITYNPPVFFDTNGKNTTRYPTQDGTSVARGADFNGTASSPNWRNVKNNAYDNAEGNINLETSGPLFQNNRSANPQYTVTIADEYCTAPDLRTCVAQGTPSTTHPFPARIRWCSSPAAANPVITSTAASAGLCQGTRANNFINRREPKPIATNNPNTSTITLSNPVGSPSILSVTVGGQTITSSSTQLSNNAATLASDLANRISACKNAITGDCTIQGYSAVSNGNVVTVFAPNTTTATPFVDVRRCTGFLCEFFNPTRLNVSATSFSAGTAFVSPRVTVNIRSNQATYPYPGSAFSAPTRTDCASAVCTYREEMRNYANWYTYYRSRMQLMKTATSSAFENIGDELRVGFLTINVDQNEALDFASFTPAQKASWYQMLFSIKPAAESGRNYSGTPLRRALSRAGNIYANKDSVNNKFSNPMQYECQNNFTLLTTDGVWNAEAGYRLGSAAMTNQDGNPAEKGKYEGVGNASSDTLADVAKYYFDTDLRTGALGNCNGAPVADKNGNIVINNVCQTPNTTPLLNRDQNMITLTLGLGVDGTLAYDLNYGEDVPGDYKAIYDGNRSWPKPDAANDDERKIDDLWHAAVNGGGRYYSAKNTQDLVKQLRDALSRISQNSGAGAALATSTVNLSENTDDYAYLATFTTNVWTGNLERRVINPNGTIQRNPDKCVENVVLQDSCPKPGLFETDNGGNVSCVTKPTTQDLCTVPLVNGNECRVPVAPVCTGVLKTQATRNIYINKSGTLGTLSVMSDIPSAQRANFNSSFLLNNLSQAASFDSTQVANLTEQKLLDYILGDKTYEDSAGLKANKLFRTRVAILGDVVNAKPAYLGKSNFNYSDSGYQAFKDSTVTRAPTVFVGANDGMLHAFDANTLKERWAFVPTVVIPNLWKLADSNYDAKHAYYVNGDFKLYDICIAANCANASASDWRTILVGGLDGGGRGYYALDVTNPNAPKLMWEIDPSKSGFQNLGYTFSEPIVTKRSGDKKWVVVFASGYNNIPDNDAFYSRINEPKTTLFKPNLTPQFNSGNGQGYLYIVDAKSGSLIGSPIATGIGSTSAPSGLAKISAYIANAKVNNEATYVYGGDLEGNLWRFNIDSAASSRVRLAQVKDKNGLVQPITTRPELGKVKTSKLVFVGTGKFLEPSDIDYSLFTPQSLYAIRDTANDTDMGIVMSNPRTINGFIRQTIVPSSDPSKTDIRVSGTSSAVDLTRDRGWYIDFPDIGERQDIAAQLVLGTLIVPTRVPTGTACQPAGYGWTNFIDYRTGSTVQIPGAVISQRTSTPIEGFTVTFNKDGTPNFSGVGSDGEIGNSVPVPINGAGSGFQVKRSIWREILDID